MKPPVSIITITHNLIENKREEAFAACLASVDRQNYPCLEHIIIDGDSQDGTQELFQSAQKINRFIFSEADTGIYNAMNKGLQKATGKYILYLNSDDFLCRDDGIMQCVEALEKEKADFCFAPCRLVDALTGSVLGIWEPAVQLFFVRMPFSHQTLMVRKSVMERLGGFDESFRLSGDYDFIIRLILSGASFVRLTSDFVSFRLGGLSERFLKESQKECIKCFEKNYAPLFHEKADYYGFFIDKKMPIALANGLQNVLSGKMRSLFKEVLSKAPVKSGCYMIKDDVRHFKCRRFKPVCAETRYYLFNLFPIMKRRELQDRTEVYFSKLKIKTVVRTHKERKLI